MYTNNYYFSEGDCASPTIYESDEVQLTQLLGPDGQPYAIRRAKRRIGFELKKKGEAS